MNRDAQNLVPAVKVADFGLTRAGPVYKMTGADELPFMVCATESLADDAHWTYKSDVWSFGVLMWEVRVVSSLLWY